MTIATATPSQLALLNSHVVQMRSLVGQFATLMNQMNALDMSWKANVSAIVGTPAGLAVTDSSNLAGITQLTDTQIAVMMTDFEAILTSYYTTAVQETMVLYCGAVNMT